MKIITTKNFKIAQSRDFFSGEEGSDLDLENKRRQNGSRTVAEGKESLKQKGYHLVKNPMFGGEEWKNDQGDLIYSVPGGKLLSIDEYIEQYVKMFSPVNREDEMIKQQWINYNKQGM